MWATPDQGVSLVRLLRLTVRAGGRRGNSSNQRMVRCFKCLFNVHAVRYDLGLTRNFLNIFLVYLDMTEIN